MLSWFKTKTLPEGITLVDYGIYRLSKEHMDILRDNQLKYETLLNIVKGLDKLLNYHMDNFNASKIKELTTALFSARVLLTDLGQANERYIYTMMRVTEPITIHFDRSEISTIYYGDY